MRHVLYRDLNDNYKSEVICVERILSAFEIVRREREQLFTGSFIETGVSTNGADKVGKLAIHIGNVKKLLMKIEQDSFLSRDLPFWGMDSRMVFRNSIYLGWYT